MKKFYREVSRSISHALRHAPASYGIELDGDGWTPTEGLIAALRLRRNEWRGLEMADIEAIQAESPKKRFEISGERIRALYGHSVDQTPSRAPAPPPAILYHGTAPRNLTSILEVGLIPGERQYVHLSTDIDMAIEVGHRYSKSPVLLEIEAGRASGSGFLFYRGNDKVWLTSHVEPAFIRLATDEDLDSK